MKKLLTMIVACACLPTGCGYFSHNTSTGAAAARPVVLDHAAAEKIRREIDQSREETREWLRRSPTSYLAAVDRVDFGETPSLTVGTAADNDLVLADPGITPHHLKVALAGDRFRLESMDAGATFRIGEEAKRQAVVDPSYVGLGRYRLRLSHQRFPAIIVFDPQSPRFKSYKGLDYFPVDLSYRYELPLRRDARQEKVTILSTRGNRRSAERVGWFDFYAGGQACRLEATRMLEPGSGSGSISVFFRDATSGRDTYPLGRYVDVVRQKSGRYLLDFNQAYNPACAFSEYYNCPVPPKANTLRVAIRAGEKDARYH